MKISIILIAAVSGVHGQLFRKSFRRIATFFVCSQIDPTCNTDTQTNAENLAVSSDGNTIIYTDPISRAVGFVDITDPTNPTGAGFYPLQGAPTNVAVCGKYALVPVDTSSTTNKGELWVFDTATRDPVNVENILDLSGQPDGISINPDCTLAVVVTRKDGGASAVLIDINDVNVDGWSVTKELSLVNLPRIPTMPGAPEPESIKINSDNIGLISLQDNNGFAILDLNTQLIVDSFSCQNNTVTKVDNDEDDVILQVNSVGPLPREPDGVDWLDSNTFAAANEGDLDGGTRGFTVYNKAGGILYDSGNSMEQVAARYGHYADTRSENRGIERASLIYVYEISSSKDPVLRQVLPVGLSPEGIKAIPSRNLLVASSEEDNRSDQERSAISIYQRTYISGNYPTLTSANRADGTPIPWASLSGLAAGSGSTLYSVEDGKFSKNRILTIDTSKKPPTVTAEKKILDSNNVFKNVSLSLGFTASNLNPDRTVNIDPEGIAVSSYGGFWIACQSGEENKPQNVIFNITSGGVISGVISLPDSVLPFQNANGFHGIIEDDGKVLVAFQQKWSGDQYPKIGVYEISSKSWKFYLYPVDQPESQDGGWVGIGDISKTSSGNYLALERDGKAGPDAAVKRIYKFTLTGLSDGGTITKTLVLDLIKDGALKYTNGPIVEKPEGLAVLNNEMWIVNDNSGDDNNNQETLLLNVGRP